MSIYVALVFSSLALTYVSNRSSTLRQGTD